jgi:hypothetical protein
MKGCGPSEKVPVGKDARGKDERAFVFAGFAGKKKGAAKMRRALIHAFVSYALVAVVIVVVVIPVAFAAPPPVVFIPPPVVALPAPCPRLAQLVPLVRGLWAVPPVSARSFVQVVIRPADPLLAVIRPGAWRSAKKQQSCQRHGRQRRFAQDQACYAVSHFSSLLTGPKSYESTAACTRSDIPLPP